MYLEPSQYRINLNSIGLTRLAGKCTTLDFDGLIHCSSRHSNILYKSVSVSADILYICVYVLIMKYIHNDNHHTIQYWWNILRIYHQQMYDKLASNSLKYRLNKKKINILV